MKQVRSLIGVPTYVLETPGVKCQSPLLWPFPCNYLTNYKKTLGTPQNVTQRM